MKKPIIGLTAFRTDAKGPYHYMSVTEAYVESVAKAGGIPVILPLQVSGADFDVLRPLLDGLLLPGGGDVDPALYGAPEHPEVGGVDTDRDALEIALVRDATQHQLPFLGICRGLQVINVALGGTLYEDIADQRPGSLKHDYHRGGGYPRNRLSHPVHLDESSRVAQMLGTSDVEVNSMHHQAVCDLAPGLVPTGYAPDGVIEALELPTSTHPFGVAVQWHPEWLQEHEPMRALFRAFIQAASLERV